MRIALLCLVVLSAPIARGLPAAWAAPGFGQRVVLADPDPELRHAMEQALAPWRLEVVLALQGSAPSDAAMARVRADRDTARFVVWRDGGELVVYDRQLGSIERRHTDAGVLDAPAAAAAALTIKMMMRLPPAPPQETALVVTPGVAAVEDVDPGPDVRLQVGLATRWTGAFSARLEGAASVRPWAGAGWRFGLAAEGGTATDVSRAGFKGAWRDWAALAVASWSYTRGAWEIEPHAGAGIRRSALDGREMSADRSEAATLVTVRGGLAVRRRAQRWTLGAQLLLDESFGTPTYTKAAAAAEVFAVPDVGVSLAAVLAVDL